MKRESYNIQGIIQASPQAKKETLNKFILKSLVIIPTSKTQNLDSIMQITKAEARKKSHLNKNPPILALEYVSKLNLYVAIYKIDVQKPRSRDHKMVNH